MPRENSNSSKSSAASCSRGRRRAQPVEVERPVIDVEAIDDDDDVKIVSPFRTRAQASGNVSRQRPLVCLDDDDDDDDVVEEVNPRELGVQIEEEVRIVSGHNHNKRVRISPNAGCSGNKNCCQIKLKTRNKVIEIPHERSQPIPPPPPPKEPTFACPVCLNQLTDPCSTTCGHVFCQNCIKTSIQTQKKCPSCRKKLTKNGFHRLYLPNTVN